MAKFWYFHCITNNISHIERDETDTNGFTRKVRVRKYSDVTVEQHGYYGHDKVSTSSYVAEIVAEDQKKDLSGGQ